MGMPESSSLLIVKDRVSEVSQSGLTQELGLLVVVVLLLGLGFVEDLIVRK